MHVGAQLSKLHSIFGSGPTFLPSDGQCWGQHGAKTLCKWICWWLAGEEVWIWRLGGSHRGGGCSRPLGEARGARAEDAALGKSMLIPLSLLQRWHRPGRLRVMGWAGAKGMQKGAEVQV